MKTIPENFTQSRSITGRSVFNRRQLLARNLTPVSELTFRDMVELDARTQVGVECSEFLGLPDRTWATEDVVVSSVQFDDDGDILVYWIARFVHAPKEN